MQFSLSLASAILAFTASAMPAPQAKVDVSGVDFSKVTYPPGTGQNLPNYDLSKVDFSKVTYPPGTGASPFTFTSTYSVRAIGANVVNATNQPAPGPASAYGTFNYGINRFTNTICYNISLYNVVGAYQSPANTATHIHEAAVGRNGPPRIAFPNPAGDDVYRNSVGCLKGPFTTGILASGTDTGRGFTVAQIEANPSGFFTDSHTALFVPGVVRGQLA